MPPGLTFSRHERPLAERRLSDRPPTYGRPVTDRAAVVLPGPDRLAPGTAAGRHRGHPGGREACAAGDPGRRRGEPVNIIGSSRSSRSDNHAVAQAVHDLGSALWFGGSVMGVAGVNKSGSDLRDPLDKIRVAESGWQRFAPAQ